MTIQTEIIAAMVHRSGLVPWMCNEIAQRMGGDHSNNTIGNCMRSLLADGLVVTVPLPQRGGMVAWQLTPRGAESVDKPAHRVKAEAAKPKCGGPLDVARIMAAEGVEHDDAYRLSIMRSDPAYHPGCRLPKFNPQTIQNGGSTVRKAIIARLTDEWQPFSAFADLGSKNNVVELLRELSVAGVLERSIHRASTPNGQSAYRLARKCP